MENFHWQLSIFFLIVKLNQRRNVITFTNMDGNDVKNLYVFTIIIFKSEICCDSYCYIYSLVVALIGK